MYFTFECNSMYKWSFIYVYTHSSTFYTLLNKIIHSSVVVQTVFLGHSLLTCGLVTQRNFPPGIFAGKTGICFIFGQKLILVSLNPCFFQYFNIAKSFFRVPKLSPLNLLDQNKSLICFNVSYLFDRPDLLDEAMSHLIKWVNEGKIQAPQTQVFSFENVADAHRCIESGASTGKLVLEL